MGPPLCHAVNNCLRAASSMNHAALCTWEALETTVGTNLQPVYVYQGFDGPGRARIEWCEPLPSLPVILLTEMKVASGQPHLTVPYA